MLRGFFGNLLNMTNDGFFVVRPVLSEPKEELEELSPELDINWADATNGKFPERKKFALFQCIEDMCRGLAKASDLHRLLQNDKAGLDQELEIEGIKGHTIPSNLWIFTYRGKKISPLHFAFLKGNVAAFSVLLVHGAKVDKEFFVQCSSLSKEISEKSKTTCTLSDLLFDMTLSERQLTIMQLCENPELGAAYFMAMLQRKDMPQVLNAIYCKFKADQACVKERGMLFQNSYAHEIFSYLPKHEEIKRAFSGADLSYQTFFAELIKELQSFKSNIEEKKDQYNIYANGAETSVIIQINQLLSLFVDLYSHLDKNNSHAQYKEEVMENLLREKNVERLGFRWFG